MRAQGDGEVRPVTRKFYPPAPPKPRPIPKCVDCGYSFRGHEVGMHCPECNAWVYAWEPVTVREAYQIAAMHEDARRVWRVVRWILVAAVALIVFLATKGAIDAGY